MLQLIGLGHDSAAVTEAARAMGATAYVSHPTQSARRPYSAMIRADTDEIEALRSVCDVALHIGFVRTIKAERSPAPPERAIAAFGLVRRPDLTHREADDHWRDVHAPLALTNHAAMCDYTQLSIVSTLMGPELDGIALCAFETRNDLSEKFFNDDDARAVIEADVAQFADPARSPRRVVLVEVSES